MRQSAFLYHLAVQTVPKTHHCLILRLTVEYFRNSLTGDLEDRRSIYEVENGKLQHFVVLSTNVLAVSVTINSTVMNLRVCCFLCHLVELVFFFNCIVPNNAVIIQLSL